MPSFPLNCPSCSAPLIIDEEHAGSGFICTGCGASLPLTSDPHKSSALPQGRAKSSEDELRRLAGAAAAVGAVNALRPEEAVLPSDHHKTVLPGKRAFAAPPIAEAPPEGAAPRSHVTLPTGRTGAVPQHAHTREVDLRPIQPAGDVNMDLTPLRGPSRFVQPLAVEEKAPAGDLSIILEPPVENEEDSEVASDGLIKRGFRLGGQRALHFSPAPTLEAGLDAPGWGTGVEHPEEAARSRRFASFAVVLVVLTVAGLAAYFFRHTFMPPVPANDPEVARAAEIAKSAAEVMRNVEDARVTLKAFLGADTIEKMAEHVRHPEITRPRMERYYKQNVLKPRTIVNESQAWSEIRLGETDFIRAALELSDFNVRPVALEIFPDAKPKVDWESFVSWAEISWKDFLKSPPEVAVDFRVTISCTPEDQYYNFGFKGKEKEMICFRLEDPEKFGYCWGYCHKDSEAAADLIFQLKRARRQGATDALGRTAVSCMLRLRFPPEGMKSNQVIIEKFVHENWILP